MQTRIIGGSPFVKRHTTKKTRHLESEQSLSFVISSTNHCFICREISNNFSTKRKRKLTIWLMQFSLCEDVASRLAFQYFQLEISLSVTVNMAAFDKADQQPGKTTVVSTQFNGLVVTCLDLLKVELMGRKCKGAGFNSAWRISFRLCPCKCTSTPSHWLEIKRTWIWTGTRLTRWLVVSLWYQWGGKY